MATYSGVTTHERKDAHDDDFGVGGVVVVEERAGELPGGFGF